MPELTRTQKQVLKDFEALGGAAWVSPDGKKFSGFLSYCTALKRSYGTREYARWSANRKKHGITDKCVRTSNRTLRRLIELSLVCAIPELPGAYRLSSR